MTQDETTRTATPPDVLTPAEAAEALRMSRATLSRKLADGTLRLKRVPWSSAKYPRYRSTDVQRLLRRAS